MAAPKKSALIVVDMQEDFCEPNGALAVKDGRGVVNYINELLSYTGFSLKIATQDFHPHDHISFASQHPGTKAFTSEHTIKNPENGEETQTTLLWPDHCVRGTKGVELIPELHQDKLSHTVHKGLDTRVEAYSAFGPPFRNPKISMSELDGILKGAGITDVFVVGLAYDFCVKCTAVDAMEHGYRTFLIEDGTKGVFQSKDAVEGLGKELKEKGVELVGADSTVVQALKG
ncbi:hypothetical protein M409DRAFT_64342 [Zasmidium cellare ATCC 36951]|uniref:nicotinamidase n=1 Tax=Zasmidium cellare ATCC 36951 TaxID=1080233 RepID=A0A6A6CRY4_ZASCE|nr:uncharacterized protein M409DRAFT_64342 [Zasmidium cellare ATCC 36951]KAF2169914.1 hypothetical protein M409DRAFT_64342 [Zasmidium cellare ATCC 36951]